MEKGGGGRRGVRGIVEVVCVRRSVTSLAAVSGFGDQLSYRPARLIVCPIKEIGKVTKEEI